MLKRLKRSFLTASRVMGVSAALGHSTWRKDLLLILAYHGVSLEDEHLWNPELYMPEDLFVSRMQTLAKSGCSVLRLQEALSRLKRRDLPEKAVVITFDDGTYDFLAHAYPVLKQFGYPVTLYQSTYYCAKQLPVFDGTCSYILWKGRKERIDNRGFSGESGVMDLTSHAKRQAQTRRLLRFAENQEMSADDKHHLLERLARQLGVDFQRILDRRIIHLLNATELASLVKDGVDLQLHTHRHRAPKERDLFLRELCENRDFLQRVGQRAARHFCYPSGWHDPVFLPWLKEAGIESAVTCYPALTSPNNNPLLLPRLVDTSLLSNVEFEGWLDGVCHLLPQRSKVATVTAE